jgi:pentose-5-phosphate-3-epimerase
MLIKNHPDIGLAIYASADTNLSSIYEKVEHNFDHLHFDLVDSTFCPTAREVDLQVIPRAKHLWPEKHSMLHIMSTDQVLWLEQCIDLVDAFLFHVDSLEKIVPLVEISKKNGKKAGLVIHNDVFSQNLAFYSENLDFICVLGIESPGIANR